MMQALLRVIAAGAAGLIAGPALAQDTFTVADCSDKGCRCTASALSMEQAGVVLGVPAPPGTQTLVRFNDDYIWSQWSAREVDMIAGGDGACKAGQTSPMVPKDGKWIGTVKAQSVQNCPQGLGSELKVLADSLVFPRDIRWQGAFHPDKIKMEGAASAIKWTQVSDTRFTGEGPSAGSSGAATMVNISVTYDAELKSPELIKVLVQLKVRAKGQSQAMLDAVGMGKCDVSVSVDMNHSGT